MGKLYIGLTTGKGQKLLPSSYTETQSKQRLKDFLLNILGNSDFFPEPKPYAVVHVVDERGVEAV